MRSITILSVVPDQRQPGRRPGRRRIQARCLRSSRNSSTTRISFMQAIADKNICLRHSNDCRRLSRASAPTATSTTRKNWSDAAHGASPRTCACTTFEVVRLTDDSAVVTYNLIVPGARPRYRHMSDTWAKDNGKWKLKFQQVTTNLWSATDFD